MSEIRCQGSKAGGWKFQTVGARKDFQNWVAVKDLKLSYHNSKAMLFALYPYCGNLN